VTAPRITEITHFHEKSDMSRWTRAHAGAETINWSVFPGPGGTMIVVEYEGDREDFLAAQAAAAAQDDAGAGSGVSDAVPSPLVAAGIEPAPGPAGPVEPPAETYFFEVASV
jgi:hypothetical protein